ncbi:MAG: hypothetical protein NT150_00500 [Bacteroidetes bacterium]|nr:hypothetical protein [Bacteroidota bacterium]
MRNLVLIFLLFLLSTQGNAQTLRTICSLPEIVNETSGIVVNEKKQVWTINDSGGEPILYLCDTLGNLLRKVKITGAWNRDWEELTRDDQGNFYIGNIGNNLNDSKDLCIFKIQNPDKLLGDAVTAQAIHFSYEDQKYFPPADSAMNFNCEAMIWLHGNLYLFSKNQTDPFDGKTYLYQLPDAPGKYVATKISCFNTGGDDLFNYWISGAALSPDKSKLVLLSSNKMWLFSNFSGHDFFSGKSTVINFPSSTQKEAIGFVNNNEVYISDELLMGKGRKLYSVVLE